MITMGIFFGIRCLKVPIIVFLSDIHIQTSTFKLIIPDKANSVCKGNTFSQFERTSIFEFIYFCSQIVGMYE